MARRSPPPGTCTDCGADAYIRLGTDPDAALICARCFPRRYAGGKKGGERLRPEDHPPRTPDPDGPRAA